MFEKNYFSYEYIFVQFHENDFSSKRRKNIFRKSSINGANPPIPTPKPAPSRPRPPSPPPNRLTPPFTLHPDTHPSHPTPNPNFFGLSDPHPHHAHQTLMVYRLYIIVLRIIFSYQTLKNK